MLDKQVINNMDLIVLTELAAKMEGNVLLLLMPIEAAVIAASVGVLFL